MNVTRAVVTAASRKQRALPLQRLVDSDGEEKSVLSIIVAEALRAGVQEICVVVCPDDQETYAEAAGEYGAGLTFVEQDEPRGYGHAVYCAEEFCANEPFLHLVGDHLHVSDTEAGCAQRLVQVAESQSCSVSAVQPTRENLLPYYGVVGGKRVAGVPDLYQVEMVIEKPTPTEAEQWLIVPGLRAAHYLCFFGMHVLSPMVMEILGERLAVAPLDAQVTLSEALNALAQRERYLAYESQGKRYDVGVKYGSFLAQMALALNGDDGEDVLSRMLQLLALRESRGSKGGA